METSKTSASERKSPRKWIYLGLGVAVVAIVITTLMAGGGGDDNLLANLPTAVVTRGELVVSIVATGEVRAQKKTTIANNMRWEAVIVERVEEGTPVDIGDVIIRFECQDLLEAIDRTELDVTAAENEHERAQQQIELTRKEWINNVAQAQAAVENLLNNRRKFLEHERTQQLQVAESQLALARQDLELAEGKLQFMESVNQTPGLEGTYSLSTIKAERLRVDRLTLSVSNAQAEVQKLELYELPQQERAFELSLADVQLELERALFEQKAQDSLAVANAEAKKSRMAMQQRQLADLKDQRELLEIRAEAPGVIVYDSGNRWDPPDLSVGALVRSRRRLMVIPDMSTLQVYSKVFEGVSEKVQLGAPVTIRLDSREDEVFTGKVSHIAPLASSEDRRFNPNVKVFPIEITLDEKPEGLKPGSSAQIELILCRLPDTLMVKIAAVYTEQERAYVWRVVDGLAHRTEVTIDETSSTHVQILSGASAGDVVLMAPPPDEAAVTPDSWTRQPAPDLPAVTPEAKPETPKPPSAAEPKRGEPGEGKPEGEGSRRPSGQRGARRGGEGRGR